MDVSAINIKNYDEDDYIYVGRPSKWGNPFSSKGSNLAKEHVETREESLEKFKEYIINNQHLIDDLIEELKNKGVSKLGCWCKPSRCHADTLVELIKERKYKSIF